MPSPLCHALLRNLDLFRPLSDAQLETALHGAAPCRLEAGALAYVQGAPGAHFFVLLQGFLKVSQVTPEGEQIIVRYVNPGDMFGLACAMGQTCYPATVQAVQESLCLAWPAAAWTPFTASHPQLGAIALQTMGHRLQDAHQRIQELSNDEVEQRVARTLLRLINQSGRPTHDGIDVGFPITRQDIAEMTGTTLHTVSRLLSDWKQRGIVASGRKRIVLRSPAALARLCEHTPPPMDCAACLSCRDGSPAMETSIPVLATH
ncbi:Crp/Fnr family transcriptional regulator [Achromobacter seleniivolatilans]|uniref:Crp/Fnr family transcriptional regulator n=1 Tax=Achromobacter seleniivolatilans TaxID=3047478 RepID=A0ABY9M771_9BURK|nr:Crp/Fnr family transcriptional regulator [Achromobacter sp. R39]WMD22854.1 Crp/Fnr family transcriptional regulator [Achromobacter sp. R39]